MDIELIECPSDFERWMDITDSMKSYESEIEDYHAKEGCLYFQMADGGAIGLKAARANRQLILSTLIDYADPDPSDLQWTPVAFCKNTEAPMQCDDTGDTINVTPEVQS